MNISNPPLFAEQENEEFFIAMEEHSGKMRQYAMNMAETLKTMNIKANEIESVIKSLISLSIVDIKMLDQVMNELTQTFSIFNAKITKNNLLAKTINEEHLKKLSENYNDLTTEISLLVKKAFELRQ